MEANKTAIINYCVYYFVFVSIAINFAMHI
jgi:hypothetical protein